MRINELGSKLHVGAGAIPLEKALPKLNTFFSFNVPLVHATSETTACTVWFQAIMLGGSASSPPVKRLPSAQRELQPRPQRIPSLTTGTISVKALARSKTATEAVVSTSPSGEQLFGVPATVDNDDEDDDDYADAVYEDDNYEDEFEESELTGNIQTTSTINLSSDTDPTTKNKQLKLSGKENKAKPKTIEPKKKKDVNSFSHPPKKPLLTVYDSYLMRKARGNKFGSVRNVSDSAGSLLVSAELSERDGDGDAEQQNRACDGKRSKDNNSGVKNGRSTANVPIADSRSRDLLKETPSMEKMDAKNTKTRFYLRRDASYRHLSYLKGSLDDWDSQKTHEQNVKRLEKEKKKEQQILGRHFIKVGPSLKKLVKSPYLHMQKYLIVPKSKQIIEKQASKCSQSRQKDEQKRRYMGSKSSSKLQESIEEIMNYRDDYNERSMFRSRRGDIEWKMKTEPGHNPLIGYLGSKESSVQLLSNVGSIVSSVGTGHHSDKARPWTAHGSGRAASSRNGSLSDDHSDGERKQDECGDGAQTQRVRPKSAAPTVSLTYIRCSGQNKGDNTTSDEATSIVLSENKNNQEQTMSQSASVRPASSPPVDQLANCTGQDVVRCLVDLLSIQKRNNAQGGKDTAENYLGGDKSTSGNNNYGSSSSGNGGSVGPKAVHPLRPVSGGRIGGNDVDDTARSQPMTAKTSGRVRPQSASAAGTGSTNNHCSTSQSKLQPLLSRPSSSSHSKGIGMRPASSHRYVFNKKSPTSDWGSPDAFNIT